MRHGIGSSRSGRKRHGNVLVLFAILLFGIFAMATLVIDLGIVRVTQRQMQTAADSAALEGLRHRDPPNSLLDGNDDPEPAEPGDTTEGGDGGGAGSQPQTTNAEVQDRFRRQAASDMVAWMYDEPDFAQGASATNFGASQMLEFSGGAGDPNLYASQLMTVNETAYLPSGVNALRLNLENGEEGDLYAEEPDRFEVKLRRTGEPVDENQRSAGPRIPFIFGRGTMLHDDDGTRQPIGDGIAVRATGIAEARPALVVGRRLTEPVDVRGGLNVAISVADWEKVGSAPEDDGSENVPTNFYVVQDDVRYVGQIVTPTDAAADVMGVTSGYVGIVRDIEVESEGRLVPKTFVIAFGLVTVHQENGDTTFHKATTYPGQGPIGVNTSASWVSAWGTLNSTERSALTPEVIRQLIDQNGNVAGAVLAPVLARERL